MRFYVYVFYDPRTATPIYVGKGQGKRAQIHAWGHSLNLRLKRFLAKQRTKGVEPCFKIVARFETEAAAHAHEISLIARIGRADLKKGSLFNLSDGGEGPSGRRVSDAAKAKLRAAQLLPERVAANTARILAAASSMTTEQKRAAHEKRAATNKARELADPAWAAKKKQSALISLEKGRKNPRAAAAQVERSRAQMKALWANPEWRAKRIAVARATMARTEVKAATIKRALERVWTPEMRARMSGTKKASPRGANGVFT